MVVPADGKYKVTVAAVNRNTTYKDPAITVYKNSTSDTPIIAETAIPDATWKGPQLVTTTADVELLAGDKIIVWETGTTHYNYVTIDYTLIERTGDSTKKSTPAKAQTTDPTAADVQVKATYGRVPQAHNLGSSFANKSASDLGTFTAEDINGDLKISGTATKVDIGKGDNYYVPVRITLPKSGAYESTAPAANSKVLIYQKGTAIPSNWTADGNTIKDFSNQFQATSEFDTAWAADILLTCADLPETNKFYFKLDLDGDGTDYEPRIITVDVSGVTKAE